MMEVAGKEVESLNLCSLFVKLLQEETALFSFLYVLLAQYRIFYFMLIFSYEYFVITTKCWNYDHSILYNCVCFYSVAEMKYPDQKRLLEQSFFGL